MLDDRDSALVALRPALRLATCRVRDPSFPRNAVSSTLGWSLAVVSTSDPRGVSLQNCLTKWNRAVGSITLFPAASFVSWTML